MNEWVEVCAIRGGKRTDAMQLAGGCLVRTAVNNQPGVFVPNSHIVDGQVVQKPIFLVTADGESLLITAITRVRYLNAGGLHRVVYHMADGPVGVQCASKDEARMRVNEFLILAGVRDE